MHTKNFHQHSSRRRRRRKESENSSSPRRDETNSRLPRNPRISFGHVPSSLFVTGKDEVEVFRVVDGIEDGENGSLF